jgi:F0F1-type ATP synthase epsilon subunit
MSSNIQVKIVFPDCSKRFLDATKVSIPSINGYMTILPNHIPVLCVIRAGYLTLELSGGSGTFEVSVSDGFVRFNKNKCSILLKEMLENRKVS